MNCQTLIYPATNLGQGPNNTSFDPQDPNESRFDMTGLGIDYWLIALIEGRSNYEGLYSMSSSKLHYDVKSQLDLGKARVTNLISSKRTLSEANLPKIQTDLKNKNVDLAYINTRELLSKTRFVQFLEILEIYFQQVTGNLQLYISLKGTSDAATEQLAAIAYSLTRVEYLNTNELTNAVRNLLTSSDFAKCSKGDHRNIHPALLLKSGQTLPSEEDILKKMDAIGLELMLDYTPSVVYQQFHPVRAAPPPSKPKQENKFQFYAD